jgi:uncharacterized protein (TIGR02246 family)
MLPRCLLLSIILAAAAMARAADKSDQMCRESDVRKLTAAVEESFNRGDAKALAACWIPDGEFIGPNGDCIDGRENIERAYRDFIATHKTSKLRLNVSSWRSVADNTALVDFLSVMTPAPRGLDAEPVSNMVLVRREGRWLIASMRETTGSQPAHHLHLKGLQWLIGDWVAEDKLKPDVSVHSTCDWTARGSYLIRKFTVESQSAAARSGTEVIGWDPRTHRIRSWSFDADGGFGESAWTRDGKRWLIAYTGTLANGGDITATHVVTPVNADTVIVQSINRVLNGEKQANLPEVTLRRQPATEEQKSAPAKPSTPPRHVLPQQ